MTALSFSERRREFFFNYLFTKKFVGEFVKVSILRDQQEMEFEIQLSTNKLLVPAHLFDKSPSYFVHAGLVFVALGQPYLHEYGEDWYNQSPRRLCDKALYGIATQEDEQVVVLAHVLLDRINYGYQNLTNMEVLSFNGVPIKNLAQLVGLVEANKKPHLRFDLDEARVIIIDAEEAAQSNTRILTTHRIPSPKSQDLMSG